MPQHKAGKLRILAITGPKRSPLVPDVPTFVEEGYTELALTNFWALLAPAGVSPEIIRRLHAATVKATQAENFRSRLSAEGVVLETTTPAGLAESIKQDTETWRRIMAGLNLTPQ